MGLSSGRFEKRLMGALHMVRYIFPIKDWCLTRVLNVCQTWSKRWIHPSLRLIPSIPRLFETRAFIELADIQFKVASRVRTTLRHPSLKLGTSRPVSRQFELSHRRMFGVERQTYFPLLWNKVGII